MRLQQNHIFLSLGSSTAEELKQLTEKFPWFQLGWLFYLKKLKKSDAADFNDVLKRVAVIVPDQKAVTGFLNSDTLEIQVGWEQPSANPVYFIEADSVSELSGSLIDKFLQKPRKAFLKADDEKPEMAADFVNPEKQSTAENDEMITETLARIYFDQKKYEKAQKAYQKLSLKFPEKSIYFASQIEKIEKLKENKSE